MLKFPMDKQVVQWIIGVASESPLQPKGRWGFPSLSVFVAAAHRFRWNVLVVVLCCAVIPDYFYFAIVYLMIGIFVWDPLPSVFWAFKSLNRSRVALGSVEPWCQSWAACVKSKQRGADLAICYFISIFFLFTEATVVLFIRSHLSKVLPWRTSSAIICISFTVCFFKQCLDKLQSGFGEKRFAVASGNWTPGSFKTLISYGPFCSCLKIGFCWVSVISSSIPRSVICKVEHPLLSWLTSSCGSWVWDLDLHFFC
jgi:hypothetical protein